MKLTWIEIANFCRNLAVLLHWGIGAADAAFLLSQEENSPLLKQLARQMDEGEPLSAAMEKTGAFPGCVTGMVSVGEQTKEYAPIDRYLEDQVLFNTYGTKW